MFEIIAKVIGPLIEALSRRNLTEQRKRRLARHIRDVYFELSTIIANGRSIIKGIEHYNETHTLDTESLVKLLVRQQELITRIQERLRRPGCRNVLGVHVPEVKHLYVYLCTKQHQIRVLLNRVGRCGGLSPWVRGHFEPAEALPYILSCHWFTPPSNEEMQSARTRLSGIKRYNELLRQFLVRDFGIADLL